MLRIAYNTTKLQANDRKNEKQPATPWSSSAISIPALVKLEQKSQVWHDMESPR
jgi:hypothetical protein